MYIFELKSDIFWRLNKEIKVGAKNSKIYYDEKMNYWSLNDNQTLSSFKIKGISESVEDESADNLILRSGGEDSFVDAKNLLNLIETTKYWDKVDDEIQVIDSKVTESDSEFVHLHLRLFRGEYMPFISKEFFMQIHQAISREGLRDEETKRLSKLAHYSLKSLNRLNISLNKLMNSDEDTKVIQELANKFKKEEKLKLFLPIKEILEKGIDKYNNIERYKII